MTLDERAAQILHEISYSVDSETSLAIIRSALIEQDKITRHANTEELLECNKDVSDEYIRLDEAMSAVMNCRGGVK